MSKVSKCDGRCCAVFPYTVSKEVLEERAKAGKGHPDDAFIADMMVPLSLVEAAERMERFGIVGEFAERYKEYEGQLYTCRHWDEETKLCTVYADRPAMCREYPYGRPCLHCGDTVDDEWVYEKHHQNDIRMEIDND